MSFLYKHSKVKNVVFHVFGYSKRIIKMDIKKIHDQSAPIQNGILPFKIKAR